MRKLASVRKISEIKPILNADNIEVALIDGWECVINKKDNFKVGDLIVYIEIDSIVPERPEFEFLRNRKFRVRVIKLRGQISNGLVVPISILPSGNWKEGDDVTEILGVKKYDPELKKENEILEGNKEVKELSFVKFLMRFKWFRKLFRNKFDPKEFPKWVKKTDEPRIQNLPVLFETEKKKGTCFEGREKIDGQSATYTLKRIRKNRFEFIVCSRNLKVSSGYNNYWRIAAIYGIESALRELIGDKDYITLQGEIYGYNIQGNKYRLNDIDFMAFNLIYPDRKVPTAEFEPILKKYGIKTVPLVVSDYKLPETIHDIVEFSKGNSKLLDRKREGIVFRNNEKNISFKVINPEFLLEEE